MLMWISSSKSSDDGHQQIIGGELSATFKYAAATKLNAMEFIEKTSTIAKRVPSHREASTWLAKDVH